MRERERRMKRSRELHGLHALLVSRVLLAVVVVGGGHGVDDELDLLLTDFCRELAIFTALGLGWRIRA